MSAFSSLSPANKNICFINAIAACCIGAFSNYLTQENLELLKNYTKFTLYMNCGSFLTSEHYKAIQDFNYIISGAKEDKDMDTVAKELTQGLFSWEFGKLYVDRLISCSFV